MRIEPTTAFIVNLMDTKGERLMSADEIQTIIDNRIGKIVDRCPLVVHPKDKTKLFEWVKGYLQDASNIDRDIREFESAKRAQNADH